MSPAARNSNTRTMKKISLLAAAVLGVALALPTSAGAVRAKKPASKSAVTTTVTTTVAAVQPSIKIVLGGGVLPKQYKALSDQVGDEYAVVVVNSTERTVAVFLTSGLRCSGPEKAFVSYFEIRDVKIVPGTMDLDLPTTAAKESFEGSLRVALRFSSADFTRADLRIVSGYLQRRTPTLACSAAPSSLTLRLAHDGLTKTSAPGRAVGGGAYFGAAAGAGQRTPFLLHVSPDGRSVTNRLAQLFVDCAAKKPYEYFSLNDFTRFPIDTDGRFSAKETWTTDADHIGLDPKHTLVVSTRTDGGFEGTHVVGVVRFDVKVVDRASKAVLDTCTSGDQPFEATT